MTQTSANIVPAVPCPWHHQGSCQQLMPRSTASLVVLSDHLSLDQCPCVRWNMSPGEQQRTGGIHGNVLLWASGCPRQSNRTHSLEHQTHACRPSQVLDIPFHAISPGLLPLTAHHPVFSGLGSQQREALFITSLRPSCLQCLCDTGNCQHCACCALPMVSTRLLSA